ncbi:hypothetical protein DIPPA_13037 [Diplonema papillatum]|nr:hypothetical protein DIPPA_13037 [Diplonema papillatum]
MTLTSGAQAVFCPWELGSSLCSAEGCEKGIIADVVTPTTAQCAEMCLSMQGCSAVTWYSSNRCVLRTGSQLQSKPDAFHKFGATGSTVSHGAEYDKLLQQCGEEGTKHECRIVASALAKDCTLSL